MQGFVTLSSFLLSALLTHCAAEGQTNPSEAMLSQQKFDYIIVGGGTAGLTVANRLSENPLVSVLVIEAGGSQLSDESIYTPGLMTSVFGQPQYDWNFKSTPQVCYRCVGNIHTAILTITTSLLLVAEKSYRREVACLEAAPRSIS